MTTLGLIETKFTGGNLENNSSQVQNNLLRLQIEASSKQENDENQESEVRNLVPSRLSLHLHQSGEFWKTHLGLSATTTKIWHLRIFCKFFRAKNYKFFM